MDIVQNILRLAKEKKITNQQLCKILETNPNKIYDWKIGKSTEDISKLADYFDVSTDYLLGRHSASEIKKDGNAEALPPDTPLTPYQKQLIEFAESLTEEEVKKVLSYIRFVLSERDEK